MRDDDGGLAAFGRLLALGLAAVVLNFVGLIAIIVTNLVVLDQSEQNQRHVDCILATFAERPPTYCVPVIEFLLSEGIIDPPTITTTP